MIPFGGITFIAHGIVILVSLVYHYTIEPILRFFWPRMKPASYYRTSMFSKFFKHHPRLVLLGSLSIIISITSCTVVVAGVSFRSIASRHSMGIKTYGGETDLWDTTWTRDEINASTFGVHLVAQARDNNADIYVDFIRITVYYAPAITHTITASAGAGGSISPSGAVSVNNGTSPAFIITPLAGNIVFDTAVDSTPQGRLNAYTFTNVNADHEISASFEGGWGQPSANANSGTTNPGNAYVSDSQYVVFDSQSDRVDYRSFGFNLPSGATIDGIRVALEGNRPDPRTVDVSLSWNGGASWTTGNGTGVKNTGGLLSVTDKTIILGGSTDTWGRVWSASDFSDSNFRVRLDAVTSGPGDVLNLDQLQVKVHYTSGPTTGTLVVQKAVVNDNGGTAAPSSFSFQVDDGTLTAFEADGENQLTVSAGAHTVTEPAVSGYTTSYSNCTDVNVPAGGSATCVITNDDKAPVLILEKIVVGGGAAADWTLSATGPTSFSGPGEDTQDGDVFSPETLVQGTYTLSESGPSGYRASAWTCTGGVQNGNQITVGLGETAYCSITNTKLGSITLTKYADPDGEFTIHVTGPDSYSNDEGMSNGSEATQWGLEPGAYTVSESVPDGWEGAQEVSCTGAPVNVSDTDGEVSFTLGLGEDVSCIFNNTEYGVVAGQKFEDMLADGVRDVTDPGLSGWTINLYRAGDPWTFADSRTTDSNGYYTFGSLEPGAYRVCEGVKEGWTQSHPSSGTACSEGIFGHEITLAAGQVADFANFGNWTNGAVSGVKFNDLDADGLGPNEGDEEPGLSGWTIELFRQGEGWELVDSAQTGEGGSFSFAGLIPNVVYKVAEVMQPNWTPTMPNGQGSYTIEPAHSGDNHQHMDFGNHYVPPAVGAPQATPGSGTYDDPQSVMLSAEDGATIRYTTDGGAPSCTGGSEYSSPIAITGDTPLRAVACREGVTSPSIWENYVIGPHFSGAGQPEGGAGEVLGASTSTETGGGTSTSTPTSTVPFSPPIVEVLGVSTETPACVEEGEYLRDYLWYGRPNDGRQVTKLQTFLNDREGAGLPVTGFFGTLTRAAVSAFQVKYAADILTPWGETEPTGNVYKTTKWKINSLWCPALELTAPSVP